MFCLSRYRGFAADMKSVKARMKSITNIQKITSAMKMVAASKLRSDEARLINGLPFSAPLQNLFHKLPAPKEIATGDMTILALSSDKGLCGGVNSAVVRKVREIIHSTESAGFKAKYISVGSKAHAGLKRLYGDRAEFSIEEVQKYNWNFAMAAIIAHKVISTNPDNLCVIYNHFKSVISYETRLVHLHSMKSMLAMDKTEWSKVIDRFNFEPSVYEVLPDIYEMYIASAIHGMMLDQIASEQSARMSAMGNASTNAKEMLGALTIQYNKARQAKITTELCEIISGATSL